MIELISKDSIGLAVRTEIAQDVSDIKAKFDSLFSSSTVFSGSSAISNTPSVSTASPISSNVRTPIVPETPMPLKSSEYDDIISEMSQKYNVPEKLVRSVIRVESDFNSKSLSSAGAMGLMQLMPGTAKSLGVTDSYDPRQNIEGGTKLLKNYIDKYGDLKLALAAYNAGPGAVAKYHGVPPYEETQAYIKKVLGNFA